MPTRDFELDRHIRKTLKTMLEEIETSESANLVLVSGPIVFGVDDNLRDAIEGLSNRQGRLLVIVDTPGGIVEVVERMVETIRQHYEEVDFVIPDRAMSAGTILVMSGDRIRMDYFSRLGPIDPQVEKDGHLVPALSYLVQYQRFIEKAQNDELTPAEFALLASMDLAELHQYEQARNLSHTLLKKWLATYKFKDWKSTRTHGIEVTDQMREERALDIARKLSDNEKWHSHGRGISRKTLERELDLVIDDLAGDKEQSQKIRIYHAITTEYMSRMGISNAVHAASGLFV
jgi:hypothetical protein